MAHRPEDPRHQERTSPDTAWPPDGTKPLPGKPTERARGQGGGAGKADIEATVAAGPTAPEPSRLASPEPSRLDPIMRVLEAFRTLDPDLPIQYALSFLTIARHEGLSIRDLSERLGIAQSSASRNVAALSRWHSFGKDGHDLVVAAEDPRERRRKIVTLTPRGRDLAARLAELVEPAPGQATPPVRRRA